MIYCSIVKLSTGRNLCAAALMTSLMGCATPPAEVSPPVDPAAQRIDTVLQNKSKQKIAGPEAAYDKPVYSQASSTVSYLGDAKNLLADVATSLGVSFEVSGPQPRLPIYVQVHAKGVPLKSLLEDVARQLSERADIVMSDTRIELRYRGR